MFGECADLRDVSEILAIGRVMPKRAIRRHPRRERACADVADVFHARCAPPTLPGYRHERRHHVAAGGELGYPVTDLDDDAGALVAADGGRHRRQPERAENVLGRGHQALPNVFIGVAQPRGNELQEHLAGARRVEIDVLDRPRCTVFVQYRGAGSHQPSGVSLRGPAFRGPLCCRGFRRAGGESAQGGDAWNRGHRLVDVVSRRDECFQLGQQCVHRPDHRIGEGEIPLDAVERSVEALGGLRQILHKVGYLTCELERSGWDTHRSAGDGLRGLRCRLCGLRRRLRGSLDVFRARNLLALHMTTMPYAGTTVWDLPGATSRPKLIFLIDGSATILAGGTVCGDEME